MSTPPPPADVRVLDGLRIAAVLLDRQRRVVHANQAALDFFGTTWDRLTGADGVTALFQPAEQGPAAEVLTKVLGGTHWEGELPVTGRDEHAGRTHLSATALYDDTTVDGVLLLAEDASSSRGRAQRLAERLTRLARVTAELLRADDVPAVTQIVIEHIADAAGATVASLSVPVDEATLRLVGLRGARDGAARRWDTYSMQGTPAGDSVLTRRALVLSGRDQIHCRYPDLETAAAGERSIVCLPLIVGDRVLGVDT